MYHRARRLPGVSLLHRPADDVWNDGARFTSSLRGDFWHEAVLAVLASTGTFCGYNRDNVAIVRDP